MARQSLLSVSIVLLISFFYSQTALAVDNEVELRPIDKHWKLGSPLKRAEAGSDINGLDLQDFGTFLWGTEGASIPFTLPF